MFSHTRTQEQTSDIIEVISIVLNQGPAKVKAIISSTLNICKFLNYCKTESEILNVIHEMISRGSIIITSDWQLRLRNDKDV